MSDVSGEGKNWVARAYSGPTAGQDDGLGWGKAIFRGKVIDVYNDPDLIHAVFTQQLASALPKDKCIIADFASGNGYVARTVVSQLERPDDRRVVPIGIDSYDKKYWPKIPAPRIRTVQGNLLDLPFKPNSFHAGILRFALPFIPKDDQPEMFKQIHDVLKPGAILVVLNYGVLNDGISSDAYNRLFAAGTACEQAVTHNPSCESMTAMANKAGFRVNPATDLTGAVVGYISPKIYVGLYKLNPDQQESLKTAFEAEKDVLPLEPKSLRVRRPMYACVLKK
jgi:ubiquinone/menaquinone biosynthesis C-methylase UbiE